MNKYRAKKVTISEKDFLKQVIDLAHIYHWKVAHFRPAMTKHGWRTPVQADGKGFPDLILVRIKDGRMIIAEVKTEKGKLTPEQEEWKEFFLAVDYENRTVEAYIWRPSDFQNIVEILKP